MRNWIARLFGFDTIILMKDQEILRLNSELELIRSDSFMLKRDLDIVNKELQSLCQTPKQSPQPIFSTRPSWPRRQKQLEEQAAAQVKQTEEYWKAKGGEEINVDESYAKTETA